MARALETERSEVWAQGKEKEEGETVDDLRET